MVFEFIPLQPVEAVNVVETNNQIGDGTPADNVLIQLNGENVGSISMNQDEKALLTIHTTIQGDAEYRWEILVDKDDNKWVPIYGCNSINISLSYAMLCSFLDDNSLAQIRAAAIIDGDKYISDRLLVEVKEEEIPDADEYYINTYGISTYNVSTMSDDVDPLADIDENTETVTLTINYMKNTGEQICDPYVATIFKGASFKTAVLSPKVAGYEPRLNQTDTTPTEVYEFNYDSVTENVVVSIYYFPIEVQYEVRYYMQGIYDDEYTLNGNPTVAYGVVGTEPDPNLMYKAFEGFVKVNHYPEVIAADGSTVFQCFYDRKYCLVDLNLDGGHGVDSVYAKFGTAFVVNTPQKPGYVFAGWDGNDDGVADELPSTVPSSNTSYKALWTKTLTSYTIVFWYENANDSNYSVVGIETVSDIMSGTTVTSESNKDRSFTNRDDDHFTYNPNKSESKIVEGDGSTVINVYYTRNIYTLQFEATGLCALTNHTHDDSCGMICTLTEHTHSCSECCDASSHYHIFSSSNTNKCPYGYAHTHGSGCYDCGMLAHTHDSNCTNSNRTNIVKQITAKYQQTIKDNFAIVGSDGTSYAGYWWRVPSGATELTSGKYIVSLDTMLGESLTFTGSDYGDDAKIYYYVEVLDGESYDTSHTYGGVTKYFKEHKVVYTTTSGTSLTYAEEFHPIEGFDRWTSNPIFSSPSSEPSTEDNNYMYYSRGQFTVKFFNMSEELTDKQATVLYEQSLSDLYFVPDYPENLEQNAYHFDGWYTTEGCYEGTKFDFETETMPAHDLILYAKWAPVTHTVTFYNTYQDMENAVTPLKTITVSHGAVLESKDIPETSNTGYTAGEWFYIKNGEKVAYQPLSIAVKEDLKVYREWTSSTVVEFTVHYYKVGTTEKVADSSNGWMFDGMTKTFKAKGGSELNQLYDQYLVGWYPTVSSTSIVADKDSDNTVIFYYDYQNPNPYTVRYVDASTGDEVATSKTVSDNSLAVVTEIYQPVNGYIPDAYYKQLVLALNKEGSADKNVITFYYTKATNSAYYAVEYYYMNPDGTTYDLHAKIQSPIAIGSAASIPEIVENGFEFEKCLARDGGETEFEDVSTTMNNVIVGTNGALIQVYYRRLPTTYTVHYYLSDPDSDNITTVKDSDVFGEDGSILFGSDATAYAGTTPEGYKLISDESQTKELMYDDPNKTGDENVFIFYYEEKLKTATYTPVITDNRLADVQFGFVSETRDVKKWSQQYNTVTATASSGFYFVGWYSDPDCKTLVTENEEITSTSKDDINYYALFAPYYTDLKISKTADVVNTNQTFVFKVVGTEASNDHIDVTVTIHGNGEVEVCHLPLGNYTITEITSWTWEYDAVGDATKSIDLVLDETLNVISFTNELGDSAWLNGDSYESNIFN